MAWWPVIVSALVLTAGPQANPAAGWRVSTSGFGPARIGMTVADAGRVLGAKLVGDGEIASPQCYYVRPEPTIEGLTIMVSRGRVVRFDVDAPGIKTRSGFGVGDAGDRIIEAFRGAVEITPHKYLAPDGNYVTIWSSNHRFAVRFETHLGKVTSFYAGRTPEVKYIEGCA